MISFKALGSKWNRRPSALGLVLLLVVSAGLNVVLALRLQDYRTAIAALKGENRLKIGTVLPAAVGTSLAGDPVTIRYGDVGVPTILYVFTPSCGWCERNAANIKALTRQVAGRYRIIGVSLTDENLAEYNRRHAFGFEIVTASQATRAVFKMGGTPQTMLIDPSGKLLQSWFGAYQKDFQTLVERELGVTLPGLSPPGRQTQSGN